MQQTSVGADARNNPKAATRPFTVQRISDVAGGEITGIDLSRPIDAATRDAILDAFLEYHVLVFRDQDLSGDEQLAFTENFGEIEGHVVRDFSGKAVPKMHIISNLDADGNPTSRPYTSGNYFWHTDKSYHAVPSLMTLLHAKELPPEGGDTQFCNMYLSYEAMPEARRRELAGLKVVHSWEANRRNTGHKPPTEAEKRERPPVIHPLIRTHPDTGRKLLYIGIHTSHVVGMPEADGRALLEELIDYATKPEYVYSHNWHVGDFVMWDNRCLVHRAVKDYDMDAHRRVLHRTVVRGTAPY